MSQFWPGSDPLIASFRLHLSVGLRWFLTAFLLCWRSQLFCIRYFVLVWCILWWFMWSVVVEDMLRYDTLYGCVVKEFVWLKTGFTLQFYERTNIVWQRSLEFPKLLYRAGLLGPRYRTFLEEPELIVCYYYVFVIIYVVIQPTQKNTFVLKLFPLF